MRQQKSEVESRWAFFWKWLQRFIMTGVGLFFAYGVIIDPLVQMVHESRLIKDCELKHNHQCKLKTVAVPK